MRDLEVNIDKLRQAYQVSLDENRKLRELLAAHGIAHDIVPAQQSPSGVNFNTAPAPSTAGSSGYATQSTGYASPPTALSHVPSPSFPAHSPALTAPTSNMHGLDYEDVGIDFVATYGRTPYLSPPPNQ